MMRRFLLSGVIISLLAICGNMPAFAQSNPDTQNTDKSEDDWRKSRKKRSSPDEVDIFKSSKGFGIGQPLPPMRPIDELPEDSRRHLKNLRAEIIAKTGPNETINADKAFRPSEAAKNDADLARQEKQVFKQMIDDMQSGSSGSSGAKAQKSGQNKQARNKDKNKPASSGQNKNPGENGKQQNQGKSGQSSGKSSGQNSQTGENDQNNDSKNRHGGNQSGSPLRGSSASSAAAILSAIKGRQSSNDNSGNNKAQSQSVSANNDAQAQSASHKDKKPGANIVLSPLDIAKRTSAQEKPKCKTSSASAYIKKSQSEQKDCD